MANPLFNIAAAVRLDISTGSSSRAAYYALVAQYQFGTPVIVNRAPAELATAIGVPLYSAVGDPGLIASIPGVVVVSFPYPTPSVVVGATPFPVSTAVPGGTIVGANYVDGNGVLWPDVDWQWQISVEAYQNTATGSVGTYDQQVVSWTGDGTANRLIPTTLDLTQGVVGIWGCGGAGSTSAEANFFRHNQSFGVSAMAGTSLLGLNNDPIAGQGIVTFEAGGFRVSAGVLVFNFANTTGIKYVAVVMRDTTTDNRYLHCGSYKFTFPGGGVVDTAIAAASHTPITHAWVWGQNTCYTSFEFPAGFSIDLAGGASAGPPRNDEITALGAGTFTVVTGADPNHQLAQAGKRYDFITLSTDAAFLAQNLFRSLTGLGAGVPPTIATGLGFTADLAFARQGNLTLFTASAIWRGVTHTGTDSTFCSNNGGSLDVPVNGISAIGAGTLDLGSAAAKVGQPYYVWAFKGGSYVVPSPPAYALSPNPFATVPSAGVVPPGISADGGQGCRIGVAITPSI